jgi:hypothetical protein
MLSGRSGKAVLSNRYQYQPRFIAAFPACEAHRLIPLEKCSAYFSINSASAPMADAVLEYLKIDPLRIRCLVIANSHRDGYSLVFLWYEWT